MRRLAASHMLVALGVIVGSGALPTSAATAHARLVPATPSLGWLRVDPNRPNTLYVEGTYRECDPVDSDTGCTDEWLRRSLDGGLTWAFLDLRGGRDNGCRHRTTPFLIAPDGRRLYAETSEECAGSGRSSSGLLMSSDGGLHLAAVGPRPGYGGGYGGLVISPADPARLYAISYGGNGPEANVVTSTDSGRTWHDAGDPRGVASEDTSFNLVADPSRPATVYANIEGAGGSVTVVRSDDAGATWTPVMTPPVTPALHSFAVSLDPHRPGLLVGRTADQGIPADRRYLSADGGRSWSSAMCSGDLQGTCPVFTVDGVFGAGYSYAFLRDGIYRFRGGGPAGSRLAISSQLLLRTSQIVDVGAGARPGDPVFLLGKGGHGAVQGVLYRSIDQGKSWQQLPVRVLPTVAPPSMALGSMLVQATHHSLAAPFVASYRTLGVSLVGLPITEAYLQGDVLTQDFERMRLEVRHGRVVIAPLGAEVLALHTSGSVDGSDTGGYGGGAGQPIPDTPTQRYFP